MLPRARICREWPSDLLTRCSPQCCSFQERRWRRRWLRTRVQDGRRRDQRRQDVWTINQTFPRGNRNQWNRRGLTHGEINGFTAREVSRRQRFSSASSASVPCRPPTPPRHTVHLIAGPESDDAGSRLLDNSRHHRIFHQTFMPSGSSANGVTVAQRSANFPSTILH